MRTYVPNLPVAPRAYSQEDEAQFRVELERVLRNMQQARPEDFVTISNDAPSGTPPQGPGSLWVGTLGAGESPYGLDELTDVTITSVVAGHMLRYSGSQWVNVEPSAAYLTTGVLADARVQESNVTQHQAALSIAASQVTSGTFADARIAQSNVTQHQAALTILESQITDGSIFARVASTESITGAWTFGGASPQFLFDETDAGVNERRYRFVQVGGDFYFQLREDPGDAFNNPQVFRVFRSGMSVTAFSIAGQIRALNSGTVGAPAYSFNDDTDTGLMWTTSGQIDFVGNGTLQGWLDTGGFGVASGNYFYAFAESNRAKFRMYGTSTLYVIGMQSAITFGALGDWAMTFQFNNDTDRGFWWGHEGHTTAQGAMSLTTDGRLTVAGSIRVGNGESDTGAIAAVATVQVFGQIGSEWVDKGTGTGAVTIDFSEGNVQHLNNTGSRTVTLSNARNGYRYLLSIERGVGAASSWTWSTTIEWVGGAAPTLSTAAGARDVIFLTYVDSVWLGSYTLGHT